MTKRIYSRGTPYERAMNHVVVNEAGCWIWNGAQTPAGYGHINLCNGKFGHVHRVVYEHHCGAIPEGLVIDHLCRVPSCVNPSHLEAVTQRENVHRGLRGAVMRAGRCLRGHDRAVHGYQRKDGRWNCRECRREKRAAGEWT